MKKDKSNERIDNRNKNQNKSKNKSQNRSKNNNKELNKKQNKEQKKMKRWKKVLLIILKLLIWFYDVFLNCNILILYIFLILLKIYSYVTSP